LLKINHLQMNKLILGLSTILLSMATYAQDNVIKGQLFDASSNNEPITFGNVTIKKNKKSVVTDFRGNYFFENLEPGTYTLEFAFLGYTTFTKEVEITKNQNLKIDAYIHKSNIINFENITIASSTN